MYLEMYHDFNFGGCCKELWIEWKLGSGLFPEQIWEEAKESPPLKKTPIARENSPFLPSFLPWLVYCTRAILVALSNNTEILHEILLCWIWPLGPHNNNNNNNFCKSATTSSTSADKHVSTKSPFIIIQLLCHTSHTSLTIWPNSHIKFCGGGVGGPLKEDKSFFFSFWRRKLRSGVSALCVSELSSLVTKI